MPVVNRGRAASDAATHSGTAPRKHDTTVAPIGSLPVWGRASAPAAWTCSSRDQALAFAFSTITPAS
jgi:hypothetical protein